MEPGVPGLASAGADPPRTAANSPFLPPAQVVVEDNIQLPTTIKGIMDRWTLQMGFPMVTVDTKVGSISQRHFLLDTDSVVERPSEFK